MQIESLKVFCDLAETRSFTRTAVINCVTQSAVSQTVSGLERQFHSLLAERSKKNFRLTREGQVVYEYSKELLKAFANLDIRMQQARTTASDNISLSTIHSIGLHSLPGSLKSFALTCPSVRVQVEYRHASQVYEDVLSSVVDLGLLAYPVRNAKLQLLPLKKEKLVLICHPQHALARQKVVKFKALNNQPFLSFAPALPTGKALHRLLRANHVAVQPVAEFDNIDALKRAVEIDAGLAIVPGATVVQEVAGQTLAALPLEGEPCRPLAVVYRKSKRLSPAMNQLISCLKETL